MRKECAEQCSKLMKTACSAILDSFESVLQFEARQTQPGVISSRLPACLSFGGIRRLGQHHPWATPREGILSQQIKFDSLPEWPAPISWESDVRATLLRKQSEKYEKSTLRSANKRSPHNLTNAMSFRKLFNKGNKD